MIGQVNKITPGVSHALASSLDFMSTIMSIVGDPISSDGVGYDLSDYLLNGGEVGYSVIFQSNKYYQNLNLQ